MMNESNFEEADWDFGPGSNPNEVIRQSTNFIAQVVEDIANVRVGTSFRELKSSERDAAEEFVFQLSKAMRAVQAELRLPGNVAVSLPVVPDKRGQMAEAALFLEVHKADVARVMEFRNNTLRSLPTVLPKDRRHTD